MSLKTHGDDYFASPSYAFPSKLHKIYHSRTRSRDSHFNKKAQLSSPKNIKDSAFVCIAVMKIDFHSRGYLFPLGFYFARNC